MRGALDTLPKLLLRNAVQHADRPAMRHKDFGIWQTWTWAQLRDEVYAFAIGLRKLGLERGDVVAIIGDNRPRLYATFAAVQSLGGIPVPVYQDAVADEMAYVLEHAEARFAVVGDQEQVDKVISIADRLPKLERIVYDEERGLATYDPARLHSFKHVQDLGREEMRANPGTEGWWLEEIAKGKGADVSVMLYTSGTTGRPKGVMLTHDNIILSAQNGNKFDGFGPDDLLLAYLPMAWVGDHIFSYGQAYAGGHVRVLPGKPGDRGRGSPRDRPHLFLRAAARVREPAHPGHGAHGGRGLAQEAHVPVLPRRGPALRRADPRRQAGRLHGTGCSIGWAISSSMRRCATAWASRARAWPIPPARPSGRSCSASTARSAST